ncbi:MAG: M23 family metallopeptidase, partial [Chloroflexota bacterium]|nr:M23 family metallopeptidase [Chloroflexota bacterium]
MASLLALGLMLAGAPAVLAVESVPLPFESGAAARVIQGYNGGSHQDASRYGLDLVLVGQQTGGAAVLSPLEGSIAWAFEPGDRTGCLEVVANSGTFGVMLCHVLLDRPYARGERVNRCQVLGAVGAAGTVGNNGSPHVHLEAHRSGAGNQGIPFGQREGLLLESLDLSATGAP